MNPPRSKWLILAHIYCLLFTLAAIYAGVQSTMNESNHSKYYGLTSVIMYSLVSLSLIVSTAVLFNTVNNSASVDVEDPEEETESMLIKRMAAMFTLNYLVRAIY
jgi:TRAP-type C4-dicarboxylate transport system permease small subunit